MERGNYRSASDPISHMNIDTEMINSRKKILICKMHKKHLKMLKFNPVVIKEVPDHFGY